jgi:flavin-dependent dehydrogenase
VEVKPIFDVVVIGAGPGGSSAAIELARAGAHVALLEAGHFPRQKVCGEFVSSESLALLTSLLGSSEGALLSDSEHIHRARFFVDRACTTAPVSPAAASIPRVLMDHALWRAAQGAGVTCYDDSPALQIAHGETMHILLDRGHHIAARAVIDATGRWSRLRPQEQSVALRDSAPKWIGVKAHYHEAEPSRSVDLYFFDGGYCGVQPVGANEINACSMMRSDRARSLNDVFPLHPALRERASRWKLASDHVSTAPLVFRPRRPIDRTVLHVGDAAGFIDPFVGDGIALALRSGHLAAQSLIPMLDGTRSPEESARQYERSYRAAFEGIFRSAERIRALLELPRPLRSITLSALKVPSIASYVMRRTRGHSEPNAA